MNLLMFILFIILLYSSIKTACRTNAKFTYVDYVDEQLILSPVCAIPYSPWIVRERKICTAL